MSRAAPHAIEVLHELIGPGPVIRCRVLCRTIPGELAFHRFKVPERIGQVIDTVRPTEQPYLVMHPYVLNRIKREKGKRIRR